MPALLLVFVLSFLPSSLQAQKLNSSPHLLPEAATSTSFGLGRYEPRPPLEKSWLNSETIHKNPVPWQIGSGLVLVLGTTGTLWYGWKTLNDLPQGFFQTSEQSDIVMTGFSLLVAAVAGLVFTAATTPEPQQPAH